jgi:malonyl CoA-acyl carrier protein transacylase
MAAAVPPFARALAAVRFREPSAPVWSGVTAAPFDDPRRRLAESLTSPVRWREVILALPGAGARRFVELAPGEVLSKMARRTVRGVSRVAVELQPL